MLKLIKLFFGVIFFLLIISFIIPFFIDKQKFVKLIEEKIRAEFNADVSFNQDIGVTFLPFPTLKINSLNYSDNEKIDLEVKKVNISISWSSIFDLKPQVTNMEILSPNLKIATNYQFTNSHSYRIFVSNQEKNFFEKIKKISKKIEVIKIKNGIIKFENTNYLSVKNLNAVLKGKDGLSGNGDFNFYKLNSKVIFDFFNVKDDEFELIMQKKINGKNKLDFSGRIIFFQNDYALDGEIKSDFLSLDDLLLINKQLTILNNKDYFPAKAIVKTNKKVSFDIKKLLVKNTLFNETKFTILNLYPLIKVQNFISKFEDSKISGFSLIDLGTNNVNGELNIENFFIKENYFGKTQYDLLDGKLNCNLKFTYLIGKKQNNLKSFLSDGICKTGKIKLKGVNIDKIAKNIDDVKDFSTLVKTINPTVFEGSSIIDFIKINFFTKNGEFKIEKGNATHKNIELETFGNFNFLNDDIFFKTNAFFNTSKFKDLPPLGINISGKINDYKIKYDFEALKQELFNKGMEKILKENKSIVIDPNEIKKMFNQKSIDPNKIFELFKN